MKNVTHLFNELSFAPKYPEISDAAMTLFVERQTETDMKKRMQQDIERAMQALKAEYQLPQRAMGAVVCLQRMVRAATQLEAGVELTPFKITSKWGDLQKRQLAADPVLIRVICPKPDCKLLQPVIDVSKIEQVGSIM